MIFNINKIVNDLPQGWELWAHDGYFHVYHAPNKGKAFPLTHGINRCLKNIQAHINAYKRRMKMDTVAQEAVKHVTGYESDIVNGLHKNIALEAIKRWEQSDE